MKNSITKARLFEIKNLKENPWNFRIMYEKDFKKMVSDLKKNGISIMQPILIARINKSLYVVDGHHRLEAAKKAGITKIMGIQTNHIVNFHDLRTSSFILNKGAYSNPLFLSDMFYEDLHELGDEEKVAIAYNVSGKYVKSMLKIKELHDDTKSIIHKIIHSAQKKYQFILEQLTPEHLGSLANVDREKQIQVVEWIFKDIIYGPPDESLVSIPNLYEILEEIEMISEKKEKKRYKKKLQKNKIKEIPLVCRCGVKYEINTKSSTIYEYVDKNNIIIKKEIANKDNKTRTVFSSSVYSKIELINLIKKTDNEIFLVLESNKNEDWR